MATPPGFPREADPTSSISAYGVSRRAGELYAEMYSRVYGFPVQILRVSNVYGPGQSPDRSQGAVAVFLHRLASGLPLEIAGDGSALRDYVYVSDVGDVVSRIVADRLDVGTINVGSGRGTTVLSLARELGEIIGVEPVLEFLPARSHDVHAITLDIARLRSFIDFAPIDLHAGLQLTWQHAVAGQLAAGRAAPAHPPVVRVTVEAHGLDQSEAAP